MADELVAETYERRFTDSDALQKHAIWREICRFLQRYVDPGSTVLDLACDRGYFIENITAAQRWATDIRDVSEYLSSGVRFAQNCWPFRMVPHRGICERPFTRRSSQVRASCCAGWPRQ